MKFGKCKDIDINLYTIENDEIKVSVSDLGATLVKFIDKKSGIDIVYGFDDASDYEKYQDTYMGAMVGRCVNEIRNGQFVLNNQVFNISKNKDNHSMHGGYEGLSFKKFDAQIKENSIIFTYLSKDKEEGYPGNLEISVEYKICKNCLRIMFSGISDQDTIFNLSNHAYFNCNGEGSILDHTLKINSNLVSLVDEKGMTTEQIINVNNIAFDYTKENIIYERLLQNHENLVFTNGYDHNYVFESLNVKEMATLKGECLQLDIISDLPNMHVYTANYLNGEIKGKYNQYYQSKSALCFECQYYPNAINYNHFIKPILKANEKKTHFIEYILTNFEEMEDDFF